MQAGSEYMFVSFVLRQCSDAVGKLFRSKPSPIPKLLRSSPRQVSRKPHPHCSGMLPSHCMIAKMVAKSRKPWHKWAMCRTEGCTRRVSPEQQSRGKDVCCCYCLQSQANRHAHYCIPPNGFVKDQQQNQKRAQGNGDEEGEQKRRRKDEQRA